MGLITGDEPADDASAIEPLTSAAFEPAAESQLQAVKDDLRERYRRQMHASIGGWSGTVITAIPTVVFVVTNAIAGLRPAIYAAVSAAALLAVYRVIRKQPVHQAAMGLIGVGIAAFIAGRSGEARNYFLIGIIASWGYASVLAVSILIRRPLVGVLWEFLDPTPVGERSWRSVPQLMRAYTWSTVAAFALFLSRAIVQQSLFSNDATGWLAFTRIAMGYPLYALTVAFAFWTCRRAQRPFRHPHEAEPAPTTSQ